MIKMLWYTAVVLCIPIMIAAMIGFAGSLIVSFVWLNFWFLLLTPFAAFAVVLSFYLLDFCVNKAVEDN